MDLWRLRSNEGQTTCVDFVSLYCFFSTFLLWFCSKNKSSRIYKSNLKLTFQDMYNCSPQNVFFQRLCSEPLAHPQVAHTPAVQWRVHDQGSWQVNRQIPAIFFSIVIGRSLLLFLNLDCVFICFVWSCFCNVLQDPANAFCSAKEQDATGAKRPSS